MHDLSVDSDGDFGSETLNSSESWMSSDSNYTNLSRASLPASPSQESLFTSKPHRSSDLAWEAIRLAANRRNAGGLSFKDFKLIRRIGSGDIGTVYLCRLRDCAKEEEEEEEDWFYAMKVVDKETLALKKKVERAETEKTILRILDHPFLPTLYAEFDASHFSCVVMEFCSGGDLHTLRHKQRRKRFSLNSARFYAAEVLLALEYLHMLGIIYRDLKPENVLVRSDGHIMLSDFDLSLQSDARPSIDSPPDTPYSNTPSPANSSRRSTSCLPYHIFRSPKVRSTTLSVSRQFVAEPVDARSCSFVGTHEYVSPEVASGGSHGNAVDWWAFGIFLYELIYGKTPFSGETNEATLRNIVKKPLAFPGTAESGLEALGRDLISGLLIKDPNKRLGSKRGAAEVKTHPFFNGLNFALIRSASPPEIPGLRRAKTFHGERKKNSTSHFDFF